MHHDDIKRSEILDELSEMLTAAQRLGQSLVNRSHGGDYQHARELNDLLRLLRLKLELIQAESDGMLHEVVVHEMQVRVQFRPHVL